MGNYTIKIAKGLENNSDAKIIRENVFIHEQGFENEFDDIDAAAVHCVVYDGGYPIAAGRLYEKDGAAFLGRIAVLKAYRGKSIGSIMISELEKYAAENGFGECMLSAQCRVIGFYEKLGYTAFGDEYKDEYCPHIMMKKALSKPA